MSLDILLVDDHAIVRQGIRQLLIDRSIARDVAEAETGVEAIAAADKKNFDVILLDISLTDMNGIEVLKRIKRKLPRTPVLMFSMYREDQYAVRALGGEVPVYAHLPTVLNEQGEKMSKRHGAMSVMGYRDAGYLPEAVVNYLARLGWSHGDAEIFSREQFVEWFDLEHLGKSAAQYDHDKLNWLNNHYIKEADNARLAELSKPFFAAIGIDDAALAGGPDLESVIGLMKDRASTIKEIAEGAAMFYRTPVLDAEALAQHVTDAVRPALGDLAAALKSAEWSKEAIAAALKAVLAAHKLKMPQLAMPVRLLVAGTTHTPSIDAVLKLFGRDVVVSRIEAALA